MSYLTNLWDKVLRKLGSLAALIPLIADQIKIAIAAGEVAKAKEYTAKAREKFTEGLVVCDAVDAALADGTLTLTEGSDIALKLEALVD